MAHFAADPALEPGTTALVARRDVAGLAYAWEPGGDADAYVQHVGPEYLVAVGPEVYRRDADGALRPHAYIHEPHIAIRCNSGSPLYVSPTTFKEAWASLEELANLEAEIAELRAAGAKLIAERDEIDAKVDALETELLSAADRIAYLEAELDAKNDTPAAPVPQPPHAGESSPGPGDPSLPARGAPPKTKGTTRKGA